MRSVITAYCNTFWFVGSILSSGVVRGGLELTGNVSWALPVWLQLVFPALIIIFTEKAKQLLTHWHGYGNPESDVEQANILLGYACFQFFFALVGAAFVERTNDSAARATVAMIFLFGAVYSIGITPLQALYPVEVLSFEMRAKGMAFSTLAKIGWRTYIVFTVWDAIQVVVFFFLLPETKRRTLEELDVVFEAKNPVKESTRVKQPEIHHEEDGRALQ
ncbi:hypothetical protein BDW02DRAFT_593425 [Decorospora gaudefroyi]|uniref:Uncharacterized protein n=1 Tax=Decorospora gaudefroyi TaxID=184978 RepID=A0A6A5JUZ3_9PLEO|nr:hypothetical protein BDW02DRAFT_593425 [Decorospora gaudefroyi]